MENDNNINIITKKSSSIRFTISTALGGIGKAEIIIFFLGVVSISLSLVFLSKINLWLGLGASLFLFLFWLFLCFPVKSGEKLSEAIFKAFIFLFKNKSFKEENIMSDFSNWKWFNLSSNYFTALNQPKLDKFGNEMVKLKIKGLMSPIGLVNINKKYVKNNIYSEKYVSLGINQNATYFISNPDGLIKKLEGSQLIP